MDRKSQILDRQKRVFRIAQDPARYGLTLKMIIADSGLGKDSVGNYARGETEMPLSALDALIGVIPDELLSLLLPAGRIIARVPETVDHDEVEQACLDIVARKGRAHRPDSPAGRDLSPCEIVDLNQHVAVLRAVAA